MTPTVSIGMQVVHSSKTLKMKEVVRNVSTGDKYLISKEESKGIMCFLKIN